MNQTKKRLTIINYAISMTDVETIQLQILKLAPLKTDEKLQEILKAIQSENYAHAQRLITRYIETPTHNVLQRTSQEAQTARDSEAQAIIDEFSLFVTSSDTQTKPKEIDINDFFDDPIPSESKKENAVDYEALLNIDFENILTDNTRPNAAKDSFFDLPNEKTRQSIHSNPIHADTFFDFGIEETIRMQPEKEPTIIEEPAEEEDEEKVTFIEETLLPPHDTIKDLKPILKVQEKEQDSQYKAIPYIAQKLVSMQREYPPMKISDEDFDSVEALLHKISHEGYTEKEIEETLNSIKTLTEESNYAEAAQLLLICAATESKFAQFMLARELYKGVLLNKDISEGFSRMYRLAMEDYPEALCDLAQFYEHGVGIDRDKKKAEQFYKEAMDFGIKRAEQHHARLKKQNRGFFGL